MSYKNIDELRAAQKKWNNSRLQAKNPAGFKKHKEAVKAFNSSNSSKPSTPQPTKSKKTGNDSAKYTPKASETKRTSKILKDTRDAAAAVKDYKPERLNVERNVYTNDLPKRPNVPKLPKLNIPGGMSTSRVANPSGLPGTIKQYKPTGDYSKAYGSIKTNFKGSEKPSTPSTPKPSPYNKDILKSRIDRAERNDGFISPGESRGIRAAAEGAKVGPKKLKQIHNNLNPNKDRSKRVVNQQVKEAISDGNVNRRESKVLRRTARDAGVNNPQLFISRSIDRNYKKHWGKGKNS